MPVHFPDRGSVIGCMSDWWWGERTREPLVGSHTCSRSQTRAPFFHTTRNPGAGQDRSSQTSLRRFNSAFASRLWAANFDSGVPALTRREHGASPWRPTNFKMLL